MDPVMLALVFAVGACVGSFLNVCISRWPLDLSVVAPRSRCPRCERPIAGYDNIPIVSWLILRGKCRGCALPISAQYPLVEALVGLGWLMTFAHFGLTFSALRVAVFGTVLLGIAITDAKHYLIPDGFTVFGIIWVMATSIVALVLGETGPFAMPYDALIGACAGAGAIAIVGWLGEVALKREAMGFGDVTLMAVIGGALGPTRALLVIFIGAAIGALAFIAVVYPIARLRGARTTHQTELELGAPASPLPNVPFGVFLAPAGIVALLWGESLISWYMRRMMIS